ncbi:MAG TPA: amino acid adenylation domain-containing protein [Anaerolineales bacterium]|nr:amino acid adenylation domain-containing protein [Anaerolineales bacterium]
MKARYLLTHAVDHSAEAYPDREALRIGDSGLSYADLATRSNQLAHVLVKEGVRPGDRVGLYLNKSLESVISLYGIMKAGGAYVPLDPFAPPTRLSYVLRDCDVRVLITRPGKAATLAEVLGQAPSVECLIGLPERDGWKTRTISWEDVLQAPPSAPALGRLTEQDLAYILYTSGSTGVPKGIMHTHRSGLSFAEWAAETYDLRPEDRLSNHAPLHFDLSTFDVFASHLAGAATVIIPEGVTKFPASLAKLMEAEKLSVWYSVPFALIQLLQHGNLAGRDLSGLRWVLFAGEPFPTKHLRQLMAQLPAARFSNLYGPTETNVCTYFHVPALESDEPVPIGRPCANVEDLVVDGEDRPVAEGEAGELLIRGGVVMKGYWGQPEKTDRAFFRRKAFDPFEDWFYRTGDLVQRQADGDYRYLGRKDRQIKTRGYRVELDEIEVVLLAHAGVEEAAVYPIPDGQGSHLIEAAAVPKQGVSATQPELMEHLASRLPPYALPVRIRILQDFPRTSTGKIDRRRLQESEVAAHGSLA